jgi:alkylation response protein AidB-like acyl-CoA dehydrogenase
MTAALHPQRRQELVDVDGLGGGHAQRRHDRRDARFEPLGQTLADQPATSAHVARTRVKTDLARALPLDALASLEGAREDTMLRVLEVKAAAAEASTEVTDLSMRVCGGAALRKEVGVERHFRDARAATVIAPTTDALYDFIGQAVCGLPLFG